MKLPKPKSPCSGSRQDFRFSSVNPPLPKLLASSATGIRGAATDSLARRVGVTKSRIGRFGWILGIVALLSLCNLAGCHWVRSNFGQTSAGPPVAFDQTPSVEQIVAKINDNSSRVHQLQSGVQLTIDSMPQLSGNLAIQTPRNLRLKAGVLGMSQFGVDIGSNDQQFWFWSKVAAGEAEPVILFANYDELNSNPAARHLPIEPQWVLDALGLTTIEMADVIGSATSAGDGQIEIRTRVRSSLAGGTSNMTRVMKIDARRGVILQQAIYDSNAQLVAYANSFKHQYHAEDQASIPRHIDLYFFDPSGQRVKMGVSLNTIRINSFYGDPASVWSMPRPADVRSINIAKQGF